METVTDREYEGEHKLTWSELTDRVSMERDGVAVDIRGVTKRFTTQQGDTVTALRNVNLSIKEHDFICVVGRSGCGKTTLLNMLAGFEKPSDGEIVAGGVPVTGPSPRRGVAVPAGAALHTGEPSCRGVALRVLRLPAPGVAAHGLDAQFGAPSQCTLGQ